MLLTLPKYLTKRHLCLHRKNRWIHGLDLGLNWVWDASRLRWFGKAKMQAATCSLFTQDFTINMAELSTLPLDQRLEAMEVLWESLAHDSAYDPSPAWHADVLAQRVGEIEGGQTTAWADVKGRIFAKAN